MKKKFDFKDRRVKEMLYLWEWEPEDFEELFDRINLRGGVALNEEDGVIIRLTKDSIYSYETGKWYSFPENEPGTCGEYLVTYEDKDGDLHVTTDDWTGGEWYYCEDNGDKVIAFQYMPEPHKRKENDNPSEKNPRSNQKECS